MNKGQKYLEETYNKHKPRLFFPIFNTVLGLGLAGALVYLTIVQDLKLIMAVVAISLIILFIASSWYNSYFSKKKMRSEIYNLQEETEILIEAIRNQKKKNVVEIDDVKKLKFRYEEDNSLKLQTVKFDLKKRTFDKEEDEYTKVDLCVTCSGLLVNTENGLVEGIGGVCPCSIWLKKSLKAPKAIKGRVYLDTPGYKLSNKTILKYLRHEDMFYDKKTGWLCYGPRKLEVIDEAIEIMQDVYVVLRDEELISLWVKLESNLEIA